MRYGLVKRTHVSKTQMTLTEVYLNASFSYTEAKDILSKYASSNQMVYLGGSTAIREVEGGTEVLTIEAVESMRDI